jgi:hypothetical protein
MMTKYEFTIAESREAFHASNVSGFLLLAALVNIVTERGSVSIIVAAILFIAAIFSRTLLVRFHIPAWLVQLSAAVFLAVATHSFLLPAVIAVFGFVLEWSYVQPRVSISSEQLILVRSYNTRKYSWDQLNNVVLKDGLLTLDFTNNKVLQLTVNNNSSVNDAAFNDFCAGQVKK